MTVRIEVVAENGMEARAQLGALIYPPAAVMSEETARALVDAVNTGWTPPAAVVPAEPPVPVLGTEPVADAPPQAEQPADAQPAKKRGRPPKAKDVPAPPANAPEPADGAGVSVPADPTPTDGTPIADATAAASSTAAAAVSTPGDAAPTLDEVKATVLALSKAIDYRTAVDMIQQMFGVSAIRDIPPDRYADAIAEARKRMAAAEEKAVADILG